MSEDVIVENKFNFLLSLCSHFDSNEINLIKKSFSFAEQATRGRERENGDPFIFHALKVAEILVKDLRLTATSIKASFIHEANRMKSDVKIDLKGFSDDCLAIVNGLDKISKIDIKTTSLQVENFRQLIVSLSSDPRVVLIKLIDRLEVMRSLTFFPKSKQLKKSNETLLLYAPLAHQLGLYNIKTELEDESLRYIEPSDYRTIVTKLQITTRDRNKLIEDFVAPIDKEFKQKGLKFELKSRTKSIYSIWRKMKKQGIAFENIYDVFAIRVILDSPPEQEHSDCWEAYSIITNIYTPDNKRLRDWVSAPKSTGYESLHITVDNNKGNNIEVQIRTERMDQIAENGIAAHWRYKGVRQMQSVDLWLNNVKELLTKPSMESESFKALKHKDIFVFTPAGDLRQLPIDASVLDFAFEIHTNLGSKCTGAKINGKIASIKDKLKTGDVVEIITTRNQNPKADWLNFVVTNKAKARIKQSLREETTKVAGLGKEILERRLKNWKLQLNDDVLIKIQRHYNFKLITDVYSAIATEEIDLGDIKDILKLDKTVKEAPAEHIPKILPKPKPRENTNAILEIDENIDDVSFKLAKCCSPIYGDDIFGFITIHEGIKIHRVNCPNATRLIEKYAYRLIKTKWKELVDQPSFQANLKITGYNEPGLISYVNDVILHSTGISMRSFNIANNKNGTFEARLVIYLSDKKQLDFITINLLKIKGVDKITRI